MSTTILRLRSRSAAQLGSLVLVISGLCSPAALVAQRPVVFQHGLRSDGSTWAQAANRLAQDFHISAHRPTTTHSASFATQASQLASQITSLPGDAVIVGHSNGGLLARAANMPSYQNRPWAGIVTVGTLHQGAPLARSMLNGSAAFVGQNLASSLAWPIVVYSWYYDDWYWRVAGSVAGGLYSFAIYMPYHISALAVAATHPVTLEMTPESPFIANLNSSGNLARESSALANRIGIRSAVNGNAGIIWKGLTPGAWEHNARYTYLVGALYLAAFQHYQFYHDPYDPYAWEKRAYAYLWLRGAAAVFTLDLNWCALIGAMDAAFRCTPSDGIVPVWSQGFPNGTENINIVGPSHQEETGSAPVESQLRSIFEADLGITPCSQVGTLSVIPTSASFNVGSTIIASVTAQSVCGQSLNVSISWWSSNDAVATVSGGSIYGASAGNATIYASAGGHVGSIPVTVLASSGGKITAVSVSGPSTVVACATARWTASVTGGNLPLTYHWLIDGQEWTSTTTAWLDFANFGGVGVSVAVRAQDAMGFSRTSTAVHTSIVGDCQ